jgi:hypothetical protein
MGRKKLECHGFKGTIGSFEIAFVFWENGSSLYLDLRGGIVKTWTILHMPLMNSVENFLPNGKKRGLF